jgi:hypothetical protein
MTAQTICFKQPKAFQFKERTPMASNALKLLISIALLLPTLAHASFLPPDLIDGVANVISWVVLIVIPVGAIALFWFVHIWPDTVAKKRQHPQRDAIHALCVLSLFFGGLLWPFAYLWAYTKPTMYKLAYGTDKYKPLEDADNDTSEK